MIAVDTNILVYAHRSEMAAHAPARAALARLIQGNEIWAIPWPCVHEFLSAVTRRGRLAPPTPLAEALRAMQTLRTLARCEFLSEGQNHLDLLSELTLAADVRGPVIHDARIAAICLAHGVRELWSADRDFAKFPQLRVVNPLYG